MFKIKKVFTVRIVYKSGYTHDFEVYNFKVKGGVYQWESADDRNKPVQLGAADIVAVYQVGFRRKLVLSLENLRFI